MSGQNWVSEQKGVTESDIKGLKNAKQLESERIQKGWQYVALNSSVKILVPCKKDGTPTKEGKDMIRNMCKYLRISI